jgi:hypothetical protein
MHLAVKSAESIKSTRPVRVLLYRGASRDALDNSGLRPLDHAFQIDSITLKMELTKYLGNSSGGPCECLMLNGTPMKKITKSFKLPGVFIFSHILIYGLLAIFCFPIWRNKRFVVSNITIEGLAIIFWLIAAWKNPGSLTL